MLFYKNFPDGEITWFVITKTMIPNQVPPV
jgi:hypothetical protein